MHIWFCRLYRYESIYENEKFIEYLKDKVEDKITDEKGILEKGAYKFMKDNIDKILPKFSQES